MESTIQPAKGEETIGMRSGKWETGNGKWEMEGGV